MFIAILDNPPRSVNVENAEQLRPHLHSVVGVIASAAELELIRDQFANIPFSIVKRDHQTWYGDTAKFICANIIWPESEE